MGGSQDTPTLCPLVLKKRQEGGGGSGKRSRTEVKDRNREEHADGRVGDMETETQRQSDRH